MNGEIGKEENQLKQEEASVRHEYKGQRSHGHNDGSWRQEFYNARFKN